MLLDHSFILHLQVQPMVKRELVRRKECFAEPIPDHTLVLGTLSILS